jgi:O-acetyl-ADP-ribose deacetylase (regulator of RNase III)
MKNQFEKLYAQNRVFIVSDKSLLSAPVDTIVNPANSGLSHGGGLAEQILLEAGSKLEKECYQIIQHLGKISVTKAVVTTAGQLPYQSVIHAVGPRMGDGEEQSKIETTIINCLQIAEKSQWKSIAFPAISTGIFCVPKAVCAKAFDKAISYYWENFPNSTIKSIWLCLLTEDYPIFEKILNQGKTQKEESQSNQNTGIPIYELNEEEIDLEDDSDISDWMVKK